MTLDFDVLGKVIFALWVVFLAIFVLTRKRKRLGWWFPLIGGAGIGQTLHFVMPLSRPVEGAVIGASLLMSLAAILLLFLHIARQ